MGEWADRTNLGETEQEKKLIDGLWQNIEGCKATINCMSGCLERGDYGEFVTHVGMFATLLLMMGDEAYNGLLTREEQEEQLKRDAAIVKEFWE